MVIDKKNDENEVLYVVGAGLPVGGLVPSAFWIIVIGNATMTVLLFIIYSYYFIILDYIYTI